MCVRVCMLCVFAPDLQTWPQPFAVRPPPLPPATEIVFPEVSIQHCAEKIHTAQALRNMVFLPPCHRPMSQHIFAYERTRKMGVRELFIPCAIFPALSSGCFRARS